MTTNTDSSRTALVARVASDRIVELQRKCHAYESLIHAFEARVRTLDCEVRSLALWPWIALGAVGVAYIFSL